MTYRHLDDLKWAKPCPRPDCIPASRPRGVKAIGLRYERALAKALPAADHGQWFEFSDASGHGYCQPDFLIHFRRSVIVLECKLSLVPEVWNQLNYLYLPVVSAAFDKKAIGLVVVKNLRNVPVGASVSGTLPEAITIAASGKPTIFHWLGVQAQLKQAA